MSSNQKQEGAQRRNSPAKAAHKPTATKEDAPVPRFRKGKTLPPLSQIPGKSPHSNRRLPNLAAASAAAREKKHEASYGLLEELNKESNVKVHGASVVGAKGFSCGNLCPGWKSGRVSPGFNVKQHIRMKRTHRTWLVFAVTYSVMISSILLFLFVPDWPKFDLSNFNLMLVKEFDDQTFLANPLISTIPGTFEFPLLLISLPYGLLVPLIMCIVFFFLFIFTLRFLNVKPLTDVIEKTYTLEELQTRMRQLKEKKRRMQKGQDMCIILKNGVFYDLTPILPSLPIPDTTIKAFSLKVSDSIKDAQIKDKKCTRLFADNLKPFYFDLLEQRRIGRAVLYRESEQQASWRTCGCCFKCGLLKLAPLFVGALAMMCLFYLSLAYPRFLMNLHVQMLAVWWFGTTFTIMMCIHYLLKRPLNIKFRINLWLNIVFALHVSAGIAASFASFGAFFSCMPYPYAVVTFVCDLIHGTTIFIQILFMYWGDTHVVSSSYAWLAISKFVWASLFLYSTVRDKEDNVLSLYYEEYSAEAYDNNLRYGLMLQAFAYQRFFVHCFKKITGSYYYTMSTLMCGVFCGFYSSGNLFSTIGWMCAMVVYSFLPKSMRPNTNNEDKLYLFQRKEYKAGVYRLMCQYSVAALEKIHKKRTEKYIKIKASILSKVLDKNNDGDLSNDWASLWESLGFKVGDVPMSYTSFEEDSDLTTALFMELVMSVRSLPNARYDRRSSFVNNAYGKYSISSSDDESDSRSVSSLVHPLTAMFGEVKEAVRETLDLGAAALSQSE